MASWLLSQASGSESEERQPAPSGPSLHAAGRPISDVEVTEKAGAFHTLQRRRLVRRLRGKRSAPDYVAALQNEAEPYPEKQVPAKQQKQQKQKQ